MSLCAVLDGLKLSAFWVVGARLGGELGAFGAIVPVLVL